MRRGSRACVVALGLASSIAVVGCSSARFERRMPSTTAELALGGAHGRATHAERNFFPPLTGSAISHADYWSAGGSVAATYTGERFNAGSLRLSTAGGGLLQAEEAYRTYGVVFDRYSVTSVSAALTFRAFARVDLTLGGSLVAGVRSNDALRARGASAFPYFRYLGAVEHARLGLAVGSKDGFLWDPSFFGAILGYAHPRVRASLVGGLGWRALPELAPTQPYEGWPIAFEELSLEPHVGLEVLLPLGLRAELGASVDVLGRTPQALLLFAVHRASRRCAVDVRARHRRASGASCPTLAGAP